MSDSTRRASRTHLQRLVGLLGLLLVGLLIAGCQRSVVNAPAAAAAVADATAAPATATSAPTATLTPQPTATPLPTATATATPTLTPSPTPLATAYRLTDPGCCADPFFLDGKVAFLDKPDAAKPAAFYAVPLTGGKAELIESRLGNFMQGGKYFTFPEKTLTVVERRSDGKQWKLDTKNQPVSLSPDGKQVVWSIRDESGPYDQRKSQTFVAALEDGKPTQAPTLLGGGMSGWLPDGRWLLSGRRTATETDRTLSAFDPASGQNSELFRAGNMRSVAMAPDGKWLAVQVALDPQPERNGMWLIRTDGSEKRKLTWFGAFAWRPDDTLIYLPFQPSATTHQVWRYDPVSDRSSALTDPERQPFKIAQSEFLLSPDGSTLVFLSAGDRALWALRLN
jgi:hypothetical protein